MAAPLPAQVAVAAACGLVFGVAFDKSRVFQPDVVIDQARRRLLHPPLWLTRTPRC